MALSSKGRLLVFARAPVPGQAKTRLVPRLGEEGAARLHRHLVEDTLGRLGAADIPIELWCAPDIVHPFFAECRARFDVELRSQQGEGLGERMAHALKSVLAGHSWAVIIGTDCPELSTADLQQALAWLEAGSDAVLGPAVDGGYYLLALRRFSPHLFEGIAWGGDRVLAQTRGRLQALGWQWRELAERHDLDRPEDLGHFPHLLTILEQDR